jgi:hypothetical protein
MKPKLAPLSILMFLIFEAIAIPLVSAQGEKTIDQIAAEITPSLGVKILNIYNLALALGGLAAIGIIIFAGVLYITSAGNVSRTREARGWIGNAVIGLILLFGSYLILNTINPQLVHFGAIEGGGAAPKVVSLGKSLPQLIADLYRWALGIGGLAALGIIIFGGILYITAAGNIGLRREAVNWIGSAVLGLVLLFGSFALLSLINPNLTKLRLDLSAPPAGPAGAAGGMTEGLHLAELIGKFYQWALGLGGLVALGVLIFGGILYITSAGNTTRRQEAGSWLSAALMGLLILFSSWLILNLVNPELTVLKNPVLSKLIPPKGSSGGFFFGGGIPGLYGSCEGKYSLFSALYGNFADPQCEAPAGGSATFEPTPEFKNKLFEELKTVLIGKVGPIKGTEMARHWFYQVIPSESGYNPNAVNKESTCVGQGTCQRGACGLFQMRCDCSGVDCGYTDWRTQVRNAIELFYQRCDECPYGLLGYGYWPSSWYNGPAP